VQQRVEAVASSAAADPLSYVRAGRHLFLAKVGVFSSVLLIGAAALRWSPAEPPRAARPSGAVDMVAGKPTLSAPAGPSATLARAEPAPAPRDSQQQQQRAAAGPSLSDELQLLDRAAKCLFDGDATAARRLLDAHRRRFRHPHLLQERHGLAVLADCTEAAPRAKASAMAFLRAHPASLLTARIERACGLGDGT
jgi:hypothetical protein